MEGRLRLTATILPVPPALFLRKNENPKYGIINTHAMPTRNQLAKMEKLLGKKQMVKVAAVDFRVGPDSRTGNGLMAGWEAKLDEFAGKL
jgi:hypothetical protein